MVLLSENFDSSGATYTPSPSALGAGTDYRVAFTNIFHAPPDYWVITNPATAFFMTGDASFGDHTSGSGQMFFFDGAASTSTRISYTTLNLVAGVTYTFSFWGTCSNNGDIPVLSGKLDGQTIVGSTNLTTITGVWLPYTVTFTVATTGLHTLSIVDLNTDFAANDGAIDDVLLTSR